NTINHYIDAGRITRFYLLINILLLEQIIKLGRMKERAMYGERKILPFCILIIGNDLTSFIYLKYLDCFTIATVFPLFRIHITKFITFIIIIILLLIRIISNKLWTLTYTQ